MVAAKLCALFSFVFWLACVLSSPACAASWTASVDQKNGLPIVSKGGSTAVSSDFIFWGKNWVWAGLSKEFKVVAPYEYSLTGKDQTLNFVLSGHIIKPSFQRLVWEFDLDAPSATADVIGGGIAFNLDLANFSSEFGEPELLPHNRGWHWGRNEGNQLEMRFDPPMTSVYFERGNKSEIRAFFYKGEVPQGHRHFVATMDISGDMTVGPTTDERFGLDDETKWPTDILDWKTSPVDLSFLNSREKPAGKHGFLTADKDKLVFQDGFTGRFWGTNLTAYTLFGTKRDDVKLQAHRLSELGFNLVRIHHHDLLWVNPNIFGDRTAPDTKNLNPAMQEKLDWWIKCLEDEGVYVWLDLEVGRQFKSADGIEEFGEISKGKPTADPRGYNYVNSSILSAMQRFNEEYLSHRNAFNGLTYKEDPGIVALLLTNENDVTHHFGNLLLPAQKVPFHSALYMAQAAEFATRFGLDKSKTWLSWLPGPSMLFLNDLEHSFDVEMIQHLRKIGVRVPIVTTSSWGNDPLSSIPALVSGDVIDVHSYGSVDEFESNPLYAPTFIDWIAAAHVVGRPISVTEWNVSPFPTPDRHTTPIFVAASASAQGWDALMQFAYSLQALDGPGRPSNWDAFNDPTKQQDAVVPYNSNPTSQMPSRFPPPDLAEPVGLVMIGGTLSPEWLLDAYRHGIFPWPIIRGCREVQWWSPDPRAIFELDGFHVSRRLERTCRSGRFEVTSDRDFASVVAGCATAGGRARATWLTREMIAAYRRLFALGHAHSVEVWREGRLVGGTYGVAIGGLFAGESMFHFERDASKVASRISCRIFGSADTACSTFRNYRRTRRVSGRSKSLGASFSID